MTVETATYIDGLNQSLPPGGDPKAQGDDHLRLLKSVLKATFPALAGAVSATHTELNHLSGVTAPTGTGALVLATSPTLVTPLLGTPTSGTLTNCSGLPLSGLTGIAALSLPVADTLNTITGLTLTAGQSVRVNAGGTAFEGFTPASGSGDFLADGSVVMTGNLQLGAFGVVFEGSSADEFETTLNAVNPTADRTVTIPDETMTVGFKNIPDASFTSGTLTTASVGKYCAITGATTIPDATFAAGDVVALYNNSSGNITITCSITTAYIAGTDSDKATVTLATRGVASILFLSGTVCVISGNVS